MVCRTVERFGQLDIQVNNAGIGVVAPLMDTDEETWDTLMNVNAKGVLLCSQAAARHMIAQGSGGRIINNASGAGKIAPGKDVPLGAYAASKHAVVALTKQMGLELSSHGILVNCVCAGIVDTPMWDLIDRETAKLERCAARFGQSESCRGYTARSHRKTRGCCQHGRVPRFLRCKLHYRSDAKRVRRHPTLLVRLVAAECFWADLIPPNQSPTVQTPL